jgi:hypothetical protein
MIKNDMKAAKKNNTTTIEERVQAWDGRGGYDWVLKVTTVGPRGGIQKVIYKPIPEEQPFYGMNRAGEQYDGARG